jgi:hypothetical protein
MNIFSMLQNVNFVAVFVATLAAFFVGGIWYSKPVFGAVWMKEAGIKQKEAIKGAGKAMAKSFLATIIMATTLALFSPSGWYEGLTFGAIIGFGIAAMSGINNMVYEMRSTKLILINAGYIVAMYIAMGTILGALK